MKANEMTASDWKQRLAVAYSELDSCIVDGTIVDVDSFESLMDVIRYAEEQLAKLTA